MQLPCYGFFDYFPDISTEVMFNSSIADFFELPILVAVILCN